MPNEPITYNFTFRGRDAQTILDALAQMPYYKVRDLIASIYQQVSAQTEITEVAAITPKEQE